jgi:hypothetical protein
VTANTAKIRDNYMPRFVFYPVKRRPPVTRRFYLTEPASLWVYFTLVRSMAAWFVLMVKHAIVLGRILAETP